MAFTTRVIPAPDDLVWAMISDPSTYPEWLVGAEEIRDIDDDWPAQGTSFHHRVGLGWLSIADRTEVVAVDPPRMLSLAVKARPFVSAVSTFRLYPCDDDGGGTTVVTLEEEPAVRTLGNLVRPVMDPSIHVRNHRSLRRLEGYIFARLAEVVRP